MNKSTKNIIPSLKELLKLEYLVASTGFSLLPKQPVHSVLAGKHSSKLRGRGLDFEEVRKYVAGDDIRNIDWRVTARTGITSTKVFTEEKEKPVLLITDMTPGMFFGSQRYTKSYIAAQLAAISAFKVLKNGDRFGGLIFTNDACQFFSPQRSRTVVLQYLKHLVDESKQLMNSNKIIEAKTDAMDKALFRSVSLSSHDYLIVVISAFHNLSSTSRKHLIQMAKHNDVILCRITDPLEEKLPAHKLVLSDGDMQLMWDSGKKNSGKKYEQSYQEVVSNLLTDMEKYGIPILQLNTTENIDVQLKTLFKTRLKIKKR